MKKLIGGVMCGLAIVFTSFGIGVLIFHTHQWYLSKQVVRPGQTWEYCLGFKDNPFETQRCYMNKVIDVKDGYVLYYDGFLGDQRSSSISFFRIGSEMVQP